VDRALYWALRLGLEPEEAGEFAASLAPGAADAVRWAVAEFFKLVEAPFGVPPRRPKTAAALFRGREKLAVVGAQEAAAYGDCVALLAQPDFAAPGVVIEVKTRPPDEADLLQVAAYQLVYGTPAALYVLDLEKREAYVQKFGTGALAREKRLVLDAVASYYSALVLGLL
jgi:hypothetical protein